MALEYSAVDGAKEPLCVLVYLVALSALPVVHGRAPAPDAAIGGDSLVGLGQLIAQRFGDGPQHARRRFYLVQGVAIPFEKPDLAQSQPEKLIATCRLQEPPQRRRVKGVGDDGAFRHRALQEEHPKQTRRAQNGQAIQRMGPELMVMRQGFERLQEGAGLGARLLQEQGRLETFQ